MAETQTTFEQMAASGEFGRAVNLVPGTTDKISSFQQQAIDSGSDVIGVDPLKTSDSLGLASTIPQATPTTPTDTGIKPAVQTSDLATDKVEDAIKTLETKTKTLTPDEQAKLDDLNAQLAAKKKELQEAINLRDNPPAPEIGETPEQKIAREAIEAANLKLDVDLKAQQDALETLKANMDATSSAMISNIQAQFALRKQQQATMNEATMGSQIKLGFRSGRQGYASEIQTSILAAEEAAGIQRLAALDAQEQMLILQAEQAKNEGDFRMLATSIDLADKIHKNKVNAIMDLNRMANENTTMAMDKLKFQQEFEENRRELLETDPNVKAGNEQKMMDYIKSVGDISEVDPTKMFESVNYFEGVKINNISFDSITDMLESIRKSKEEPDRYEVIGTPANGVFEITRDPITKEVLSNRQIIAPTASTSGGSSLTFSPNQRRIISKMKINEYLSNDETEYLSVRIPDALLDDAFLDFQKADEDSIAFSGKPLDVKIWVDDNQKKYVLSASEQLRESMKELLEEAVASGSLVAPQ